MEHELLDAPVEQLTGPNLVFRHTRDRVHPTELAGFSSGGAELAKELAVERELLDLARNHRIDIDVLCRPRRDAERIRPQRVVASVALSELGDRRHPIR